MLMGFRNDGHAENSIPPKLRFAGGIKSIILAEG